jgi:hypothetical protein
MNQLTKHFSPSPLIRCLIIVASFAAMFTLNSPPAHAIGDFISYTANGTGSCSNSHWSVSAFQSYSVLGSTTQTVVATHSFNGIAQTPVLGTVNFSGTSGPVLLTVFESAVGASFNLTLPYVDSFTMTFSANGTDISNTLWTVSCSSGGVATLTIADVLAGSASVSVPSIQFFNPGDNRVDGKPGDRLVVDCTTSDKIIVYGVADDLESPRNGFYLTTFSYKALAEAGPEGLTQSVSGLGSVSASLINGWYWIAWNGGKYHANGQGGFVKNFQDEAWCGAAH